MNGRIPALHDAVGAIARALCIVLWITSAAAAQDDDAHNHDVEGADRASNPEHDHGPFDLHFSHPIVAESPSPDTKVRLDYGFSDLDEDGGVSRNGVRIEVEYAFHPSFSIELDVPYTFRAVEEAGTESSFDNVEIALKFANFAFAESGILLGYGIEFGLPTGDPDKGIGSDHIVELVPFLDFGYKRGHVELVSFAEFAVPTNQNEEEEVETEFEFTFSSLYHFAPRLEGLLEFDGATVLSGEEAGETVLNVNPGLKFRLLGSRRLAVGLNAGFPLTNHREFDVRVLASVFYHF